MIEILFGHTPSLWLWVGLLIAFAYLCLFALLRASSRASRHEERLRILDGQDAMEIHQAAQRRRHTRAGGGVRGSRSAEVPQSEIAS